jgi:23S rRNA pseudouridine1911/1915/1917 synthase
MLKKLPSRNQIFSLKDLLILYEDNHLIAVNKPPGMLVQGDRSGQTSLLDLVKQYIKQKYQKPGNVFLGLVHRLDRPVGGLVLFAKTSKAAARLSEQWRSRQVNKVYWAQINGRIEPTQGVLKSFLKKDAKKSYLVDENEQEARQALLSYRTLKFKKNKSLLEITLYTGRKHQIRVQLADLGYPIAGDLKYGAPFALPDQSIRLMAKSLRIKHPTRNEYITIESPDPQWD